MRRIRKKMQLHRVSITIGNELFGEMLMHWDHRVTVSGRHGARQARRNVTPESMRDNISSRMARLFTRGDRERVIWPQHLKGSIVPPRGVEIVVDVSTSAPRDQMSPEYIAMRWFDIMTTHMSALPHSKMEVEVVIRRYNMSYGKFVVGHP